MQLSSLKIIKYPMKQICTGLADKNFSEVTIDINIPWDCPMVKYYIKELNFKADMLITTSTDYLSLGFATETEGDDEFTIYFDNSNDYSEDTLATVITTRLTGTNIVCKKQPDGRLKFTGSASSDVNEIWFIDATHRIKILLGMMNVKPNIRENMELFCTESPTVSFRNLLYLTSLQGESVPHKSTTPSIIYRINQFMRPGLPVVINKKGDKIIRDILSIKQIKMVLTDAYLEPVILCSPLYVAIEIKAYT
jgi:hypothetical protein